MKWHVLLLLLAPLLGFVAADAGKLFGKLSKAYKAPGKSDHMEVEMAETLPEVMTISDQIDEEGVVEPALEQSLPMEHRHNNFFDNHYTKVTPYGPGWYPSYGGMAYDENHMLSGGSHPNMRVNMDGNVQENAVP